MYSAEKNWHKIYQIFNELSSRKSTSDFISDYLFFTPNENCRNLTVAYINVSGSESSFGVFSVFMNIFVLD